MKIPLLITPATACPNLSIAKVNRLSMGDIPYLPALEKARTRYVVRWLNRKKFARTVLNKE